MRRSFANPSGYDYAALHADHRARIARWFRHSEAGPLFYDHRGQALHVLESESIRLEAEAAELLDGEIVTLARRQNRFAFVSLALAFAIATVAAWFAMPSKVCALLIGGGICTGALGTIWSHLLFRGALRGWRRQTGLRLAAIGRGGVPEPIAAHHRRHNLFRIGLSLGAMALAGRVVWLVLFAPAKPLQLFGPDLAIVLFILACVVPARRIDATHRRRKWLD